VDGMLDAFTPQQFDEWIAYNSLEPIANDWQQAATIAATVHNEMEVVRCMFGDGSKPDFHDIEHYIPTKEKAKPVRRRMTVEEMVEQAKFNAGGL